jgi:hypothetical protein
MYSCFRNKNFLCDAIHWVPLKQVCKNGAGDLSVQDLFTSILREPCFLAKEGISHAE